MIQQRDIPAGKVLISEGSYDELRDELAHRTILHRMLVADREYRVVQSTPGWECAGSVMRWTNGYYLADNGANGGQQCKTEEEAYGRVTLWAARRAEQYPCLCPDDCNCHYSWRTNYCGCKAH